MTLQDAKQQIAQKYGFYDWILIDLDKVDVGIEMLMDQAAQLYARSKWDEACTAQKGLFDAELLELSGIRSEAPKPEFKP